jgi:superfamily II DNA/RNA helicase
MHDTQLPTFADLNLPAPILKALKDVGYETPSPIQAATIPLLMEGRDILGQAQTGTGKTAAFALPVLSRIDVKNPAVQALVLAPTRELAIQVAEAFQSYAAHLKNSTCCRSTAARPTARSCRHCAAARRSWSAPRAASSTTWTKARSTCPS